MKLSAISLEHRLQRLLSLPYKATFQPPLVYLREPWFQLQHAIRQTWWRQQMRRKECKIHSSLEIRGQKEFAQFIECDRRCVMEKECFLWIADEEGAQPYLSLAENVYLARNVYLGTYHPIKIGRDSLIGAYSYIISANHRFEDKNKPIRLQGYRGAPINIGCDVWVGCHVTILPGVTIGDGAVIAAGAVVNRDVPPLEIWGGVTAKKIGQRGEDTE